MTHVIGLMSGTSVDGIDAALVDVAGTDLDLKLEFLAGATYPYPPSLRKQILAVCGGASVSMPELAELDDAIALAFAQAAQNIQIGHTPADLIGSHGQTIYHRPMGRWGESSTLLPNTQLGYSLQLGRGAVIAHLTGIPTVSNFRSADIAAGGQGAPLVPKVDAYLLSHPQESRCVQNIGGIGNVAYLPARLISIPNTDLYTTAGSTSYILPHSRTGDVFDSNENRYNSSWVREIRGWDTGPGNTLLDLAVQHLSGGTKTYDQDGGWAATGTPCYLLVEQWLQQDYFQQLPPKSTGREQFGWDYLHQCMADAEVHQLSPADLLATLTELTVASIVHSYRTFLPQLPEQVLLCGGGSRNLYLKHRLQTHLESVPVLTTNEAGLSADFKEAIAFAVLAYWRQLSIPGNLPQVTGARLEVLLGDFHQKGSGVKG